MSEGKFIRVCANPDESDLQAHYEVPRETYKELQALALRMDKVAAARPYAATLQSSIGQIVCVTEG